MAEGRNLDAYFSVRNPASAQKPPRSPDESRGPAPPTRSTTPAVAAGSAPGKRRKVQPGEIDGDVAESTLDPGNRKLVEIFKEMGVIQRLKGDRFRARAYNQASRALQAHPVVVLSGAQAKSIAGIGDGMARRIDVVLATGELKELSDLQTDPEVVALRELQTVHGIGVVRAAGLLGKGIRSLADLRAAVARGDVHLDVAQTIGLRHVEDLRQKIPRAEMVEHESLLLSVKVDHPGLRRTICGSYRREKQECGDIDVAVTAPDFTTAEAGASIGGKLLLQFVQALRDVGYLTDDLALGTTKYMGLCCLGAGRLRRRIDVRCFPSDQYHFGVLSFTGSDALMVQLRRRAMDLGMTLNEYCLEDKTTGKRMPAASERDIFEALGTAYLEPSQR